MQNSNIIAACELHPNAQKQRDTHPDITGRIDLNSRPYTVVVWTRTTQDGQRIYHSCTIAPPYRKGATEQAYPILKTAKMYEFRKRKPTDPDYQSVQAYQLLDDSVYLAMWVTLGTDDDEADMAFRFEILRSSYSGEISAHAAETMAAIRARLAERNLELMEEQDIATKTAARNAEMDGGKVSLNELGEPDNVPF